MNSRSGVFIGFRSFFESVSEYGQILNANVREAGTTIYVLKIANTEVSKAPEKEVNKRIIRE